MTKHSQTYSKEQKKRNLKFNLNKIQYKQSAVSFFGETYTTTGRKPDPGKIEAIKTMKQPENKKELQSFLGLCQYLTKFTPELVSLSEPLRFLTRKNTPFICVAERLVPGRTHFVPYPIIILAGNPMPFARTFSLATSLKRTRHYQKGINTGVNSNWHSLARFHPAANRCKEHSSRVGRNYFIIY